ncbi:MAG TPA: TonB-dependent receptor [Gemmatimonadales bacterium]|jgi:iron complex outermembrane receptor protein|nr:TonB-dependent receptor [Gemmatimonadales bacterium]
MLITILVGTLPSSAHAQATGTITGRVTESNGRPLSGVVVKVHGVGLSVATRASGRYALASVSAGQHQLLFRRIGYGAHDVSITVTAETSTTVDAVLDPEAVDLGAVVVEGVSRAPERMIDAPAAVSVVRPATGEPLSITGQVPLALTRVPGLDVPQSAVNDFNANARGFNTLLSRKMLVLQDGRDLATVLVLRQTWGALSLPLEDLGRIEVIRGPASALYGPNAYNGVISITTPAAREIVGTKLTLGGGELGTIRADLRQAGLLLRDRVGYRVNLGYTRSEDWTKSRTAKDSSDWRQEYAAATTVPPSGPGPELRPLSGQIVDSITGYALGTPHPLITSYGSARVDYYSANGMFTLESGVGREEYPVFMTGVTRNQAREVLRPWARLAWDGSGSALSAWYSGSSLPHGQVALASGARSESRDRAYHLEGHTSRPFAGDAGRVVVGASVQNKHADTKGTLLGSANDDRCDHYYGVFTQVEYRVLAPVRLVGAVRVDDSNIYTTQLSPRAAVVFTPVPNHTVRAGVSRAFLTPSLTQLFVAFPTRSGVQNLSAIETQLRADPAVGPALAAVPNGTLFTNSAAVPDSTLGNRSLLPQTMISYEVGYKGQFGRSVFLAVDMYAAHIEDFTTPLLPAGTTHLNPLYQPWTAPTEVPAASREAVEAAAYSALAIRGSRIQNGLTRLPDGTTAIVLTTGNAGTVTEWGLEVGSEVSLTRALTLSATYTWFNAAIHNDLVGNVLSANTPRNKGTVSLAYAGRQGLDVAMDARFVAGYHWTTGVWDGDIPASQNVSLSAGYRLNPHVRAFFDATNLLDQPRFEVYGGSVNGRRVLVGMTMMK